jgi:hypothetical protein
MRRLAAPLRYQNIVMSHVCKNPAVFSILNNEEISMATERLNPLNDYLFLKI